MNRRTSHVSTAFARVSRPALSSIALKLCRLPMASNLVDVTGTVFDMGDTGRRGDCAVVGLDCPVEGRD